MSESVLRMYDSAWLTMNSRICPDDSDIGGDRPGMNLQEIASAPMPSRAFLRLSWTQVLTESMLEPG